jgi:glycosyltransferase involved in cell wall biosynthesis
MSGSGVLAVAHSPEARLRAEQLLEGFPVATVVGPLERLRGAAAGLVALVGPGAEVLYLVDVGRSTVPFAVLGRLLGKRVLLDTGDAGYALARSLGERGFLSLFVVGAGERIALRSAHEIVVRGRLHAELLPRPATHIPDLAPPGAEPVSGAAVRRRLGLEGAFVVGLVGSLIFSPRRGVSYGWDLLEALVLTDPSVHALVVGDGSGLARLRERAAVLGVADRCRFVGRVPVAEVGAHIGAMNAAISTQSNDVVGRVRTTGKLPLYLACGCPVIATDVGEAAVLLGPHGWTQGYAGVVDRSYPRRLAAAIEAWRLDPAGESARRELALGIAARHFDPEEMRARLRSVIERVSR